jgi:hypothetical protein
VALSIDRAVGVGGITVGLIGSGIVVVWPDKRWLGWIVIGLGLLIAAFAVVWALAGWHARKEFERDRSISSAHLAQQLNQHTSISPVIAPVFAPTLFSYKRKNNRRDKTFIRGSKTRSWILNAYTQDLKMSRYRHPRTKSYLDQPGKECQQRRRLPNSVEMRMNPL